MSILVKALNLGAGHLAGKLNFSRPDDSLLLLSVLDVAKLSRL